jgi:hypothetical protein
MDSSGGKVIGSDATLAAAILLLGTFLAATGAAQVGRWQREAARAQSLGFEDLLGIVANTTGLIVVAWWVLSMLVAFTSAALEQAGKNRAAEITGKFSPNFMRRLALAAVGLQLLGAPLAHASTDTAGPGWRPADAAAVAADWSPTDQPAPRGNSDSASIDPGWKPTAPVIGPGALAAQPARSARQQPVTENGTVTVTAGDSLWSIAARHLGGSSASDLDIAMEWPRWYQANRSVLGENPDVLLPGQVLKPPSAA